MTIFYFTATGNSLAVAKRVGGELISIPKALKDGESGYEDDDEDDAIGFVFPDFDGSLPRIMTKFMKSKKFKADYFFAIATYGFFPGNTIRDFTKLKRMKEFRDAA